MLEKVITPFRHHGDDDRALAQKYENILNHNNGDEVKVKKAAQPMMVRTMAAMSEGAGSI